MNNPRPWEPESYWTRLSPRQRLLRSLMDYADTVGARGSYKIVTDEEAEMEFELQFQGFHD